MPAAGMSSTATVFMLPGLSVFTSATNLPLSMSFTPDKAANAEPSNAFSGDLNSTVAFNAAEASGVTFTSVTIAGDLASGAAVTEISST